MNGDGLSAWVLIGWANGPQESAQGAARNEQALGFGDNAPCRSRPRSEGAQERRRTGLHFAWSPCPQPRSPAPIQGALLRKAAGMRKVPGQHSPRLGPPWADSFAPLARPQERYGCCWVLRRGCPGRHGLRDGGQQRRDGGEGLEAGDGISWWRSERGPGLKWEVAG